MALIEITRLTKLYRMGTSIVRALDGVDLSIEPGEFVAITGASGSGKSTMMHLIGCLDRPTSGSYVLNGKDVSSMSDRQLAIVRNKEIGFVFQTFNLINRTSAADNVGVPLFYARRADARAPAMKALERVGLGKRSHHRPNELSGGERQRVAIARAIVNDPPLVLADEPTGNLDTRTGEQIMEIFHELNRHGVTIVLVTHEYDVALQARRIVNMRDGRILWDKTTSEVRGSDFTLKPVGVGQLSSLPNFGDAPVYGTSAGQAVRSAATSSAAATSVIAARANGDAVPAVPAEPRVQAIPSTMTATMPDPRITALPVPLRIERRPGSSVSMIMGLIAVGLTAGSAVFSKIALHGIDPSKIDMQNPPPGVMGKLMMVGLISMGALLGSLVLGIIGTVLASKALRFRPLDARAVQPRTKAIVGLISSAGVLLWYTIGIGIATYALVSKMKPGGGV